MNPSLSHPFRPICPRCASRAEGEHALGLLARDVTDEQGRVVEGALVCPRQDCQTEYPIIDGVPLLFADVRRAVAASMAQIETRDDFSPATRSRLGDCLEPGSVPDTLRLYQSTYAFDHFGEFFPRASVVSTGCEPGGVLRCLAAARSLIDTFPNGPILDIGCAVGRSTLELAMDGRPVLGLDANIAMLRLARKVAQSGSGRAAIRRVGMVYEPVEWTVPGVAELAPGPDFWCADAELLPLPQSSLAGIVALNCLDCLSNPAGALLSWAGALKPGGVLLLTTPFDWSGNATPLDAWLGGHSQRGPERGASEAALRRHLSWAGFEILGESSVAWGVRLHDRASTMYNSFVVAARRNNRQPGSTS
ncbi:MAG: methyltransferase domain-containing protein [Tepidisphaera sp.]|nr:methyltransferase domain-containing protein [Tepidisphaera sp.]